MVLRIRMNSMNAKYALIIYDFNMQVKAAEIRFLRSVTGYKRLDNI